MHKELSAPHKFHYEEDFLVCLEDVLHANQEGVVRLLQDVLLEQSRLNLVVVKNDVFPQRLHGVDATSVRLLHEENLSKTTLSNDTLNLEVLQYCFLLCWLSLE